jgi:transcriptional antiterminator RfaH
MPVLPMEENIYPRNLFEQEQEAGERAWWVLHTKPRQEKALARQMLEARIPFYLPLVKQKTIVRGRLLESHVPLFGGYLFLLAEREERVTALSTQRVVRSLQVAQQGELWRDLAQVNRLISSGLPVTPEQKLYPGKMVIIRTGPLAGLRGKIIREVSRRRFVVQVDFIQKGVSALLEEYMLAPVKE